MFHGTSETLAQLDPRQAYSHGEPDGEPAVCAAEDVDTAIFMALQRSALALIENKDPGISSGYSHRGDKYHFYASPPIVQAMLQACGYVHVLPRGQFHPYYGEREMRSTSSVIPTEVIKVTMRDFPHVVYPRN